MEAGVHNDLMGKAQIEQVSGGLIDPIHGECFGGARCGIQTWKQN